MPALQKTLEWVNSPGEKVSFQQKEDCNSFHVPGPDLNTSKKLQCTLAHQRLVLCSGAKSNSYMTLNIEDLVLFCTSAVMRLDQLQIKIHPYIIQCLYKYQ